MTAVNLALIMFLLIVVGYAARKLNIVDQNFGQSLSMFLYNFVFPAIIISSMNIPVDKNDSRNFIILVLIGLGTIIVMYVLSFLTRGFFRTQKEQIKDSFSGIMSFALMFPNFTFMAYPVMETLFPEKGLLYISIYTIPARLIVYVAGPLLIKSPEGENVSGKEVVKSALKALLTPPVIAVPLGIAVYYLGITFPVPIASTLEYLARTATPLGMVLTGILLAQAPLGRHFTDKRLYWFTFIRLIVAPALIFLILFKLPLDPVVIKLSVMYSALPAASSTAVIALQYKGDASKAAGTVFFSTVFSIITIPIWAYLLELLI